MAPEGGRLDLRDGSTVVRPWREEDAPALALQANDRRVWIGLRDAFPHPYGLEDARRFIAMSLEMSPRSLFAIEVQGAIAGGIGYARDSDVERIGAEVGYWVGHAYWGRGIATAALRLLTRHAFEIHADLRRLYALPFASNQASARVLSKAGYRCEGTLRESVVKDGQVLDQWVYSILRHQAGRVEPVHPPTQEDVDLYDGHYGHLAADPQVAVRRETYDEDLGQSSWITLAEALEFFRALDLGPGRTALEVACGSGGITCRMALETGAVCTGVDINARGVEAATKTAREQRLENRVTFRLADAGRPLPLPDAAFDAVFCNDAINHLPGRLEVLRDWHRLLRPGGRLLFTDPIVVTGPVTKEEIRARSSIGFYLFTPQGCNERLLAQSGFEVREVRDVTEPVASVSRRWHDARAARRDALTALEGQDGFEGVQRFLEATHTLASERRLSRFMYLASKPPSPAA
jgi:RimJ/RimL family protein N-acetyltransferase/SAM-dependent methyltransferase